MTYTTNTTWTEARSRWEIIEQFNRWNNDDWKAIGEHDFPVPEKVGSAEATVRFELRGTTITVSCSSQVTYRQNLRCVAFAVEAMRMNEKRGIADTLAKAYLQLGAPQQKRDPYEVLGVRPDTPLDDIKAMYLVKAKRLHGDVGGDDEAMKEVNEAWEEIQQNASKQDV